MGVGLWLDGVPCNWDRSESVKCVTLNMPGLSGEFGNLRMPIALVEHKYVLKHKTFDDIFAVVAWSLRQCAIGKQPSRRHDNLPWPFFCQHLISAKGDCRGGGEVVRQ